MVSGLVFILCAPRTIFGGMEGVESILHVLWASAEFACFAQLDPFFTVQRMSGQVFMFCSSRPVFGGTEGVGTSFNVLRSWTSFRRYRGRRVQFLCFALLDPFSAVPRTSVPVFIF
jgi:hypothetical protein